MSEFITAREQSSLMVASKGALERKENVTGFVEEHLSGRVKEIRFTCVWRRQGH